MYRSRINDNNNSNNNRTEDGRAVTHYFAHRKCAKISVIRSNAHIGFCSSVHKNE